MFVETIKSEGLAHLSYVVGDGHEAAVVDPRLDVEAYLEVARRRGVRITSIIETHRHEDFVSGARLLGHRTGARVVHGEGLDWGHGELVSDGDVLEVGGLELRVLDTPGHTLESISVAVVDRSTGRQPIAVFTGDALFVGDVGRTDFYPDRAELVAGLLWDSLHHKLLPLGDQALVLPAHGAGSVCGSGMADRDFSTLGYERFNNPALRLDRPSFVRRKLAEHHPSPPYFERAHAINRVGDVDHDELPAPPPLSADELAHLVLVDVRSAEAICGAFVPGAIGIPLELVPSFAGWLVPADRELGLIVDRSDQVPAAARALQRLGIHQVAGWLEGGMVGWCSEGRPYQRFRTVPAAELRRRIEEGLGETTLLDVRSPDEVAEGRLEGARHVYAGELPNRLGEVPPGPVLVYCSTGMRATVAASVLARSGYDRVEVALGSLRGCVAVGCPTTW